MDKEKLLAKIKENREKQAEKYFQCIEKIVKADMEYYKDKEYAEKFK